MIVKCLDCAIVYERKSDSEKCCDKCVCLIECPNCGCKNFEKINKTEAKEPATKKQILHD